MSLILTRGNDDKNGLLISNFKQHTHPKKHVHVRDNSLAMETNIKDLRIDQQCYSNRNLQ